MSSSDILTNAPRPRLCNVVKWPDFNGYGFNLHSDKHKTGQFIGDVDTDSPASTAGLRKGDRIIEVNGVNISNENHTQVVERIKAVLNETKLLVLDSEADRWYKERDIIVFGDQENILYGTSLRTPSSDHPNNSITNGSTNGHSVKSDEDSHSVASVHSSSHSESSTQPQLSSDATSTQNGSEATLERETCPSIEINSMDYDNFVFGENSSNDCAKEESVKSEGEKLVDEKDETSKLDCENDPSEASDLRDETSNDKTDSSCTKEVVVKEESCSYKEETTSDKSSISSHTDEIQSCIDAPTDKNDEASCPKVEVSNDCDDGVAEEVSKLDIQEKECSSINDFDSQDDPPNYEEAELSKEAASTAVNGDKSPMSTTPSPPPSIVPEVNGSSATVKPATSSFKNGGLNLNMTAAEMRAQLASKKKFDPRNDSLDLKRKYQIIQNM